jgi:hypothetical protein
MAITSSIERLAERMGVGSGSRKIGRTTLARLSIYYGVTLLIVAGFIIVTDNMKGALLTSDRAGPASDAGSLLNANPQSWSTLTRGFLDPLFRSLPPLATGAAAVIGSFLLSVPMAFTYVRTRNRLKYDQSLVQTVIMLPVVVAAILMVVQNSIALAFSLAGIVAAVRFRNNLKDSRDAVYVFAAVGIGFAAGVGMLAIAAFLSVFFCILELLLWKLDLTADHEHTFGLLCMPAPRPVPPGNSVVLPAASGDASASSPSADTGLLAIGGGKPEPVNGEAAKRPAERLLLYVTDPDKARALADPVLEEMTKAYKLKKTRNGGNNQFVLEYRVRFRRKSPSEAVIDRLHTVGTPYVIGAEVMAADAPEKG